MGCLVANISPAEVVFNTFGSGTGYGDDGVVVGGPLAPFYDRYAEQFFLDELGPNYLVDSVSLAVLGNTPNTSAIVSILQDNADSPNITAGVVAQVQVDLPLDLVTNQAIVVADFNDPGAIFSDIGLLSAGQSYWLTVEATDANEFIWADSTDLSKEGFQGISQNGGPWQVQFRDIAGPFPLAAYSVNGVIAVPEPNLTLGCLLVGGIYCCRRRRPSSFHLDGESR